jgi:predicted nuclease of restriction endonuclease-like (RecB) superfamily
MAVVDRLPTKGSDLAKQILKDPYQFDFLTLAASAKERELERGLLAHLRDLLLELDRGFASSVVVNPRPIS